MKRKNGTKTASERTRDAVYTALFAALIVICSMITVPGVIPFTMQTFGVFVALGLLGGKRGSAAVIVYVFLGLIGLPVFSGFKGGIGVLAGPTGGYIVGFIVGAFVYWLFTHFFGEKSLSKCFAMILALIAVYAFGTAWFVFVMSAKSSAVTVGYALTVCVIPFIPFDCAKIALALFACKTLGKYLGISKPKRSQTDLKTKNFA